MNEKTVSASLVTDSYSDSDKQRIGQLLDTEAAESGRKIIVLDDDPTGVQTVHDVHVYTNWEEESIRRGFNEQNALFFILTNSRGFTEEQTIEAHRTIARRVAKVAAECGKDYMIVSRSDSTLRGHFPLETTVLRDTLAASADAPMQIDGEILCPYFREGGRFTIGDVHYVKYGEELVPAADTEFAKDETFGYHSSNLKEYVEEKTKGAYPAAGVTSISLEMLRAVDVDGITQALLGVTDFGKVIVNATCDTDVKVFAIALYRAMKQGRHFLCRCAAALVKAIGNISDQPLLTHETLFGASMAADTDRDPREQADSLKKELQSGTAHYVSDVPGGIIVVGSHTKKTTAQLNQLLESGRIEWIELDSDLVLREGALAQEADYVTRRAERLIEAGKTVCISTKRQLLVVENDTPEQALLRSVAISDALQSCVGNLTVKPSFVVAKGGITSSDVGTKALRVTCARVMGQIEPGVPVWETDADSKFPGIPYVIFPGNVGEVDTLAHAVGKLL